MENFEELETNQPIIEEIKEEVKEEMVENIVEEIIETPKKEKKAKIEKVVEEVKEEVKEEVIEEIKVIPNVEKAVEDFKEVLEEVIKPKEEIKIEPKPEPIKIEISESKSKGDKTSIKWLLLFFPVLYNEQNKLDIKWLTFNEISEEIIRKELLKFFNLDEISLTYVEKEKRGYISKLNKTFIIEEVAYDNGYYDVELTMRRVKNRYGISE